MVNSKFTPIAKVKKQQRDKVETSLSHARFAKQELERDISLVLDEILDTSMPQNGNISIITLIRERLAIMRRQKDTLQEKLIEQDELIYKLQIEYKNANIEYEKIKYLEEQDYEAWVKKTKKQEQLDLDEIATMLFKSNN